MYGREGNRKSFVEFDDFESARKVHAYYYDLGNYLHRNIGIIKISWGIYKPQGPENTWVAVVARNLPPGCRVETIHKNFSKKGEKVKLVLKPEVIMGILLINYHFHTYRTKLHRHSH